MPETPCGVWRTDRRRRVFPHRQLSDITEAVARCKLEARAWFTRVRTNGAVPAANIR